MFEVPHVPTLLSEARLQEGKAVMARIPNKVLVQARVRPATVKELKRRASKAGLRFCTYLAQEIERIVRCCDNGNFGDGHECQKQPGTRTNGTLLELSE